MSPPLLNSYIESGNEYFFDSSWTVIRFDTHRYYKRLSGLGLKGVDFIAYHPDFGIALIECKSYQTAIPPSLDQALRSKRDNTITVISTIHAYYQRQWSYRLLTRLRLHRRLSQEVRLWTEIHRCISEGRYFFLAIVDY